MNEFKLPIKYNWELAHKPIAETPCSEQPYKTGIYDYYPWFVTPTMIPTCTKVIDTPAYPTSFPSNIEGYKVVGSTSVNNDNYVVRYVGTVEITSPAPFYPGYYPWKTSGNVTTFGDGIVSMVSSAFANGALVRDLGNSDNYVPADYMGIFIDEYAAGAFDMYLIVASTTSLATIVADTITFEYEFLVVENSNVKFTIY